MSGLCSYHKTISLTWINNIWLSFSNLSFLVDLFLVGSVIFIHSFLCSENFFFLFSKFLVFELIEVRVSRPLLHKTPPWPNHSCKRELVNYWQSHLSRKSSFRQFSRVSNLGNTYDRIFLNPEPNFQFFLIWNTLVNRFLLLTLYWQKRSYLFHNSLIKNKAHPRGILSASFFDIKSKQVSNSFNLIVDCNSQTFSWHITFGLTITKLIYWSTISKIVLYRGTFHQLTIDHYISLIHHSGFINGYIIQNYIWTWIFISRLTCILLHSPFQISRYSEVQVSIYCIGTCSTFCPSMNYY